MLHSGARCDLDEITPLSSAYTEVLIPIIPLDNRFSHDVAMASTVGTMLCTNLTMHGWSQHNCFLSPELNTSLAGECRQLRDQNILVRAQTGKRNHKESSNQLRGDRIAWLQAGQSQACDAYLDMMEQLRILLNQSLYLGLEDYESHFSFYAPGASYSRHVDRFHNDDARTISVVIYLNDDWIAEQGGALRLHPVDLPSTDITPIACRMVMFLSADMLHEVMPASRDRMSLTGWFRRRSSS